MPTKRIVSRTAMTARVRAAFCASGGLNAGTPVAIASVPVRATAPAANERSTRSTSATLVRSATRSLERRIGSALTLDDDLPRAHADHQEGAPDEEIGRDREDVPGLAQASQVRDRDERHHGERDDDGPWLEGGDRGDDLLAGRRDRDRDRQDIVDQERRRRDRATPGGRSSPSRRSRSLRRSGRRCRPGDS